MKDIDTDGLHGERDSPPDPVDQTTTEAPARGDRTASAEAGEAETAEAPRWRAWVRPWMAPWLASLKVAGVIWLAAGAAYIMIMFYDWRFLPANPPGISDLLGTWYRFDTVYYVRIAEEGYLFSPYAPAFYPLYPLLIKLVNPLLPGGGLPAALVLSVFFALVTLVLLHRIVDEEFGDKIADRTTWYLATFPAGFFLFAAYNESLYIALVLAALYAARKGHFWVANVAAVLAGSTRLFGVLLAAPIAYEYMRQRGWNFRRIRWDALGFLTIPSGVVAYSIYLHSLTGDWLAFSHAQDHWQRKYGWPGEPVWKTVKLLTEKPFLQDWRLLGLFNLVSVIGVIALLLFALKRRSRFGFRPDQNYLLVYAAVPILLFLCTEAGWPNYLMSAPRIAMEWFPAFIVLGMLGRSRTFERFYLFMALTAQGLFLAQMLLKLQFVA